VLLRCGFMVREAAILHVHSLWEPQTLPSWGTRKRLPQRGPCGRDLGRRQMGSLEMGRAPQSLRSYSQAQMNVLRARKPGFQICVCNESLSGHQKVTLSLWASVSPSVSQHCWSSCNCTISGPDHYHNSEAGHRSMKKPDCLLPQD
jgi:hypothetical protein